MGAGERSSSPSNFKLRHYLHSRVLAGLPIFLLPLANPIPALGENLPFNPDVTQATIATTICQPGWTRTARPYVAQMKQIKAEMLAAIGEPIERRNRYELDHRIPLALGGAPVDRRNLALQPIDEAREKDGIEACLSSFVCQGKIDLEDAQSAIWEDWRKAGELCGGL